MSKKIHELITEQFMPEGSISPLLLIRDVCEGLISYLLERNCLDPYEKRYVEAQQRYFDVLNGLVELNNKKDGPTEAA